MKFRKNLCPLVVMCCLLGIGWFASSQNCFAANMTSSTNASPASSSINIGPFIGQEAVKERQSATVHEWTATILDFVKSSLWPVLAAVLLYVYRTEIKTFLSKKLPDLVSANTPLGSVEFAKQIASKKMDTPEPENGVLQAKIKELGVQEIINSFVNNVTKVFLRESSWNGLKVFYLCTECNKKNLIFDLKQACELDGSMSYDYAFGYVVASCSAQFLRYESPDNIRLKIVSVHGDVYNELAKAINDRLEFIGRTVGENAKNDFASQLTKIKNYIALLESSKGR
jgi:hypothetical protein